MAQHDYDRYEKSAFDFGEKALETAFTSKEGSRDENYPIKALWGSEQT